MKFIIAYTRLKGSTVNELLQKLIDAAKANGGKTTYPEFLASISYEERQYLPRAIKLGKANGTLKSYLVWDAEAKANTHILEAVTA